MMRGTGIPACGRSGTAPDLVVEMLSPSTARLDLKARRCAYATAGVAAWWVFRPERRILQFSDFSRDSDKPVETLAPGDTLTTPVLPGLELSLEAVFKGW
jgi:Uma2 family endonuclease